MAKNQDEIKEEDPKICFLCKRPESKAGKMVEMGGDICICCECMQRAVDSMQASGLSYNGLVNLADEESTETPENTEEKEKKGSKIPSISMINLSDLFGGMGLPRQQVKKKKTKEQHEEKV